MSTKTIFQNHKNHKFDKSAYDPKVKIENSSLINGNDLSPLPLTSISSILGLNLPLAQAFILLQALSSFFSILLFFLSLPL